MYTPDRSLSASYTHKVSYPCLSATARLSLPLVRTKAAGIVQAGRRGEEGPGEHSRLDEISSADPESGTVAGNVSQSDQLEEKLGANMDERHAAAVEKQNETTVLLHELMEQTN